jgi:hypothetical protein
MSSSSSHGLFVMVDMRSEKEKRMRAKEKGTAGGRSVVGVRWWE